MSKKRLVQHRVHRDTSKKETAALKRENETLKRQVARLRKQLNQEEIVEESEPEESVSKLHCPACQSTELASFATPSGKTRYACRSCKKWRGTLPASL